MIASKLPNHIRIFEKKRSLWACCTAFLILVQLIVVLLTFTDYGITIDEPPQAEYGKAIFDWFRSGFQDPEFFNRIRTIDLERYGGLFDTLVYPLTRLLPFDRFETRHLCNALIGLLGIGIIYRLGAHIGSPSIGFLAALFLILTPRYYGHSFNNPKDIPFAVCYLLSLYHLIRSVDMLPDLPWKQVWKTGLAIGLALGVRFGGLLLFVYLGLAFFIRYLNLARPADRQTRLSLLRNFVTQTAAIFAIAWTSMLAFWPRALIEPFTYPIQVLRFFSDFTRHNTTFFEGQPLSSVDVPWYYAPKWFLISSPEFLLIGLAIAPIIALAVLRHSQPLNTPILPWSILSLSAFFPLIYVIVKGSPLYDGFRHFLFVLPPVALIAAASIHQVLNIFVQPALRLSLIGLLTLLTSITLWDMVRLHPNQVVYFNRLIAGGLQQAAKHYQTDYWENSYKQGIRWIEANYDHPPDKRLRIGAGSQNAKYALDPNRYEFVEVPENIDLYLSTTWDDRHKMVPGEIVHTIQRDSVALFYIIRPDDSFDQDPSFTPSAQRHITLANQYDRSRNETEAFQHYQEALSRDPDNPNVLANLGRHYLLQKKYQDAVPYLERALELEPNYLNAYLHLGTAFHALGQIQKAAQIYLKTIALKPDLREPYVNLAIILIEMERWPETVKVLTEATKIHTDHPRIWQMLAQAYRQLGDLTKADDSISRAFQLNPAERSIQEEYALVAADYQQQNQLVRAGTIYQNILERNPKIPGAAFNLGLLYYKQKQFPKAIAAYEQAVSHSPKDPKPLLAMSLVFERQGNYQDAISACQKALTLTPDDPKIKARLQALETAGTK